MGTWRGWGDSNSRITFYMIFRFPSEHLGPLGQQPQSKHSIAGGTRTRTSFNTSTSSLHVYHSVTAISNILAGTVGFEPTAVGVSPLRQFSKLLILAAHPRSHLKTQVPKVGIEPTTRSPSNSRSTIELHRQTKHTGGSGGIRTPGGLSPHDGFQDRYNKPLCHRPI